jgi:hypothetical protein
MEIKPVILVLADISGYTRFIKYHRVSLIHAEKIITELLESVIASADKPLVLHEIEGDAVNFYAIEEDEKACAGEVLAQVERFVEAFRRREAELISECSLCECEACQRVGQLKIKVVLHRGEAAFARLRQFTKVAGEDVILAHRLLKNTIPSNEYILMTEQFVQACSSLQSRPLERRTEHAEGLGEVTVYVLDFEQRGTVAPTERSLWNKLKMFGKFEGYLLRRLLTGPRQTYRKYRHLKDV